MPVQTRASILEAQVANLAERLTRLERHLGYAPDDKEAHMTTYRERHLAGVYTADNGEPQEPEQPQAQTEEPPDEDDDDEDRTGEQTALDDMTQGELLAYAREIEAKPANKNMSKAELRESIDSKLNE